MRARPQFYLIFLLTICLIGCGDGQSEALTSSESEQPSDQEASIQEDAETTTAIDKRNSRGKKSTHLLLGTGSVQGVYFPIGGVICRLLNRHQFLHRIRCSLESTGGSIYNLRQLRDGNFDLVFAQSDWQHHAYHGTSTFKDEGANPALRSVFALEADPLAVIVTSESDIEHFDDLVERTVSFGYARSLQHRIINDLLAAKGWDDNTFKRVRRMSDTKQVGALCSDEVEAILLLNSSLDDHLRNIDEGCDLRLVPITGDEVKRVIAEKPYYRTGIIPKGSRLGMTTDIESFGLGASFVALESTSPKAIYHVVKEIVENFKDFQSLHPSLETLSKKELPYAGLSAPLHPGAIRYYREARLIK